MLDSECTNHMTKEKKMFTSLEKNDTTSDGSFAFKGVLRGKLYLIDFVHEKVELDKCLIAKRNMG
jgi:hypothetical protein